MVFPIHLIPLIFRVVYSFSLLNIYVLSQFLDVNQAFKSFDFLRKEIEIFECLWKSFGLSPKPLKFIFKVSLHFNQAPYHLKNPNLHY